MNWDHDWQINLIQGISLFSYMLLERWLGKTQKIKATSLLELLFQCTFSMLKKIAQDKNNQVSQENIIKMKNLKEVIALLNSGVKLGIQIAKDGHVSVTDVPLVFDLITKIAPALEDVSQVPAELLNMSDADMNDLVSYAITDLKLPDGKAKDIVQASLAVLTQIYHLAKLIKG